MSRRPDWKCFMVQFRKAKQQKVWDWTFRLPFPTNILFFSSFASLQPTRQTDVSTITATPVQRQAAELSSHNLTSTYSHEYVFISKRVTFATFPPLKLRHLETPPTPFRFENVRFGREETETFGNDGAETHVRFLIGSHQPLRVLPSFVTPLRRYSRFQGQWTSVPW